MMQCILLLAIAVAGTSGQLFLGPCPRLPEVAKNVDLSKLQGQWYVAARSEFFPISGYNCSAVHYEPKENGLDITFTNVDPITRTVVKESGSVEPSSEGGYQMRFHNFPISLHYAILSVDYEDYVVEYTCQPGALDYLIRIAVLTRKPLSDLGLLDSAVSKIPPLDPAYKYPPVKTINHKSCTYE